MRRYIKIFLFIGLVSLLLFPAGVVTAETRDTDHVWGDWITLSPATCSEPGREYRECVKLPDYPHYEERQTPALGHDYGPWVTVREATTEQTGLQERVCRHNSTHVIQRVIPKKVAPPETTPPETTPEPKPAVPKVPTEKSTVNTLDVILSIIATSSAGFFLWAIWWDYRIIFWSNRIKSRFWEKGGFLK